MMVDPMDGDHAEGAAAGSEEAIADGRVPGMGCACVPGELVYAAAVALQKHCSEIVDGLVANASKGHYQSVKLLMELAGRLAEQQNFERQEARSYVRSLAEVLWDEIRQQGGLRGDEKTATG